MPEGVAIPRSQPTLADVARRAGVSTATVSRALNAPESVAPATRERVAAAVSALGYLPHFGARAMAARRTNTIGAVIPTMENAIFARGIQAFQETLGENGYTLLVASHLYRPELEADAVRTLVARGAEGLLLIGLDRDDAVLRLLRARGIPAVVTWAFDPASELPTVGFDNRAAMRAMVERVLELGHRRLGAISAPTARNDRARERVLAIREGLRAAGLDPASLRLVETPYGIDTGAAAFETLMAQDEPPTAIICGNDVLAAGAAKRARELGIAVPAQVSITGFDDIELARVICPALTTVRVPHRRMGEAAARALISMLRGEGPPRGVELFPEICMRESLGPPPRG